MDNLNQSSHDFEGYRVKRAFKESVEPEEILLDAAKPAKLDGQKLELPIKPKIFKIFLALMLAGFLILVSQTAYLQIIKGEQYQNLAERNRTRIFPVLAARGIIYDRNFTPLVHNIPSFDLVAAPSDLSRDLKERTSIIERVAEILGVSASGLTEQINRFDFKLSQEIPLVSNLEHEKVLFLETELSNLPGFRIEKNTTRQYVNAPYFSHLLGYLGKLGAEEIKKNSDYFLTEKIGKAGLELIYEKVLRGQAGQRWLEIDALGRLGRKISEQPPQAGQGLILTIDSGLQKQLYDSLSRALRSRSLGKAAAVALDPRSGGVLAAVSLPGFDNNLFTQGLSDERYADLADDTNQPFFNRAIAGQYPPGSTIKPLIGAAALEEKVITPLTEIYDYGEITIINQYYPEVIYRFGDWAAHGPVNIFSAIARSCNVFFYTIGGGYGKIEGLGIEKLDKYFRLFGFGQTLGIDLPGERAGLVPTPVWKQKFKSEDWYIGDTYHVAIGQGDLLVTPLQVAAATAVVANGGRLITPHLVDKIVDSDKNIIKTIESKILRADFIDQTNLEIIKKAMRQTVTAGSALLLNDLAVSVAGKTGTAQVAGQKNPNAWFVGFAPSQDPEIVLVILLENAGEGAQVAVPIAKEVLSWYFR